MITLETKVLDFPNLTQEYTITSDGVVYNSKGRALKQDVDPRRPNQPSAIYLKCVDGSRYYLYLENIVAKYFIDGYHDGDCIIHKDGDIRNCAADNLETYTADEYINKFLSSDPDEMWKPVDIGKDLLYKYYVSSKGRLFNGSTYTIVKPFEDTRERNKNLLRYTLYLPTKTGKYQDTIHYNANRLVAIHFIGMPLDDRKDNIYFKDGNNHNLDYRNLAWGDRYDVICNAFTLNPDRKPIKLYAFENEKWKPIDFIDDLAYEYEISSYGRVYNATLKRMLTTGKNTSKLATNLNNQSYVTVGLTLKDGSSKSCGVHVLVATKFVQNPDPERYNVVNHINGNPECNWAMNLEWCTTLGNMYHALKTNLQHTSLFEGHVTDEYWRTRTICAWLCSVYDFTTEDGKQHIYDVYTEYTSRYPDTVQIVKSKEELMSIISKYFISDKDFHKLYSFYYSGYHDAYNNINAA